MRLNQIEAWALEVLEAARRGTLEDDHVELKGTWPDARRTARRLAGQANAARGEPVIWLVGVADDGSIVGAPPEEVSNWWAQVVARFADDVYPTMQHVAIPEEGATVVALVFETDRAPYVITVGEDDARAELEVPWREATRVRSARRRELLLMLSQAVAVPQVDVLESEATLIMRHESPERLEYSVSASLYLDSVPDQVVTLPYHRVEVGLVLGDEPLPNLEDPAVRTGVDKDSVHAVSSRFDVTLTGPARVYLTVWGNVAMPTTELGVPLRVRIEMPYTRSDVPVRVEFEMPFFEQEAGEGTVDKVWRWSA